MNKEKIDKKRIWIIWAGPAWIFLSLLLLKNLNQKSKNLEIHLFEENFQLWKKLKLTWNWKMNISNKIFWVNQFFSNEERILKNFFKNNLTKNSEKIFDEIWIEYFWKWNRAILKNENAKKEVENLEKILEKNPNIFLHKWEKISEIEKIFLKNSEKFFINWDKNIFFDKIILASWWILQIWKTWKSWNKKSEIYSIPEKLWHKITKTEPSLSPILIRENPFSELSGSAFFWEISDLENKNWNKIIWDILFTHKWLSWPAILDFTANEISENCEINFFPNLEKNKNLENIFLEKFIRNKEISEKSKEKISDFIKNFATKNILPKKIINFILEKTLTKNSFWDKISDTKISDISKKNFLEIRKNFFHLKINNCQKMDYQFCRTTKWWIDLKEININSLESKIHKNLFFAWEILDINWLCWWYNISFAAICAKIISNEICK